MSDAFYNGFTEELEKIGYLQLAGAAAGLLPVLGGLAPWAARAAGMSAVNVARAGRFARFTRRPLGIGISLAGPLVAGAMAARGRGAAPKPPPTFQTPEMPQAPPTTPGTYQGPMERYPRY